MTVKKRVDKEYVLSRMQKLCSLNEKCSFDIEQKIRNYPLGETEQKWIKEKLKEEKFVDDGRYASFFVKDKFKFNKWGKTKIAYALKMKRIDEKHIEEALSVIEDDEYQALLHELIKTKNKELDDKDLYKKKAKIFRFVSQRGFETDLIYRELDKLTDEDDS
jgi:regulatory protein